MMEVNPRCWFHIAAVTVKWTHFFRVPAPRTFYRPLITSLHTLRCAVKPQLLHHLQDVIFRTPTLYSLVNLETRFSWSDYEILCSLGLCQPKLGLGAGSGSIYLPPASICIDLVWLQSCQLIPRAGLVDAKFRQIIEDIKRDTGSNPLGWEAFMFRAYTFSPCLCGVCSLPVPQLPPTAWRHAFAGRGELVISFRCDGEWLFVSALWWASNMSRAYPSSCPKASCDGPQFLVYVCINVV